MALVEMALGQFLSAVIANREELLLPHPARICGFA